MSARALTPATLARIARQTRRDVVVVFSPRGRASLAPEAPRPSADSALAGRMHLRRTFLPLYVHALGRAARRAVRAIETARRRNAEAAAFGTWLEDFRARHAESLKWDLAPLCAAHAGMVRLEVARELGRPLDNGITASVAAELALDQVVAIVLERIGDAAAPDWLPAAEADAATALSLTDFAAARALYRAAGVPATRIEVDDRAVLLAVETAG